MNYNELDNGTFFSCKVKYTYTEVFVRVDGVDYFAFSIQKKDWDNIIGLGQKTNANEKYIPITLTEDVLKFIASKCKKKIGSLATNLTVAPTGSENQFYDTTLEYQRPTYNVTTKLENKVVVDYISLLDDVPVVYVNSCSIDCKELSEEDVEVEDVEIGFEVYDKKTKDYSKLIWAALAAAAILFR